MLLARFALHPHLLPTTLPHPDSPSHRLRAISRRLHDGYYTRVAVADFIAHRLLVPLLAPEPPMA
ncbi:MAG: hypothetical protein LCH53_01600 [Bacteroidetes bacterium]|nr:hypothetical protein [Bacteroidota bacterium]